jgi:PIN domain nuclease of toxin-antitoxin system
MRLLLDTCVFAWSCAHSTRLSSKALDVIADPANEVFLSAVSVWELSLKISLRQMVIPPSLELTICNLREQLHVAPLPFDEACAEYVSVLPQIHADPFDRALISAAVVHELTIVTPDRLIRQYAVKTIW